MGLRIVILQCPDVCPGGGRDPVTRADREPTARKKARHAEQSPEARKRAAPVKARKRRTPGAGPIRGR